MKAETHLTRKGQVVIPKKVRDRLGWRSGMRIRVEASEEGTVLLRPDTDDIDEVIDQLAGCLEEGDALAELEAEHRAEVEEDDRRLRRRR